MAGGLVETLTRAATSVSNDVTGRIESTAIHLHLISVARERELDRRLIAGLPSGFTWGYLALLLIGAL